ncbi:MAG: H/ACA RNA-protein complex protein Gar1 [Thermoproteus sp. JCHS_4]|jgi:snoRNP protein GAR1|nr:MAG: H/ACA RNA-protein complex protein Gar1 [Thermoproteus sp. CIS_19]KUO88020.1 MAG: H/ACA RNA-protein complex protein Gar1 [Thermoproteus sp. JCHS_4]
MLRRIGYALHYTNLKNLVVKLSQVPPLYITIYTYTMKKVGTLYDVIGNVEEPYGLVKPVAMDSSIVGQAIYINEADVRKKRRRGGP